MSDTQTAERLRQAVAEEVRVAMARRRCNGAKLAERIGRSEAWVSRRLTGAVSWDLDDLAAIADALHIDPAQLLPARRRPLTRQLGERVVAVGGERRPVRLRGPARRPTPSDIHRPVTPLPRWR